MEQVQDNNDHGMHEQPQGAVEFVTLTTCSSPTVTQLLEAVALERDVCQDEKAEEDTESVLDKEEDLVDIPLQKSGREDDAADGGRAECCWTKTAWLGISLPFVGLALLYSTLFFVFHHAANSNNM